MQNSLLQLLFVLATLSSLTEASPVAAPQSTSASSLRKRVIVHDFLHARRDQISKRYTNGTTFIDLPVAQRELERLSQKYNQSNTRYQKHIKSGKVKRNAEQFAIRSVSAGEPYDLALHRRNSLQKRQNAATVSLTDDVELGVDVSYYSGRSLSYACSDLLSHVWIATVKKIFRLGLRPRHSPLISIPVCPVSSLCSLSTEHPMYF